MKLEDDDERGRPEDEFLEELKAFFPHIHVEDIAGTFDPDYDTYTPAEDAADEYHKLQLDSAANREEAKALLAKIKGHKSNNTQDDE